MSGSKASSALMPRLLRLYGKSLLRLGETGHVDEACRMAAEAWALLRTEQPESAEYLNGILHALTRNEGSPTMENQKVNQEKPLEVRHLPPAQRHELIIQTFIDLQPGEAFILINDHDPKPLYYQFAFEYKDQFSWDVIEAGPEVWRVRIGKVQ